MLHLVFKAHPQLPHRAVQCIDSSPPSPKAREGVEKRSKIGHVASHTRLPATQRAVRSRRPRRRKSAGIERSSGLVLIASSFQGLPQLKTRGITGVPNRGRELGNCHRPQKYRLEENWREALIGGWPQGFVAAGLRHWDGESDHHPKHRKSVNTPVCLHVQHSHA